MSETAFREKVTKMLFPKEEMLASVMAKLKSQREIRNTAARGPEEKAAVEDCLEEAFDCVNALCSPGAVHVELRGTKIDDQIIFQNGLSITNKKLVKNFGRGTRIFAYLVTCGYDSRDAFKALDGDYAIYHFQYMIGRELLFLAGRELHKRLQEQYKGAQFIRYPLSMHKDLIDPQTSHPTVQNAWDPLQVRKLVDFFDGETLAVQVKEEGCLEPLHSLAGIVASHAPIN